MHVSFKEFDDLMENLAERSTEQLKNFCHYKCPMRCTKLDQFKACPLWGFAAYSYLKNAEQKSEDEISHCLHKTHDEFATTAWESKRTRRRV